MKHLGLILTVLLIIGVIVGVFVLSAGYVVSHQDAWQMDSTAQALANAQLYQVEAQEAAKRAQWFSEFYQVLFTALLCVGVGAAGVYGWKVVDERGESKSRAVDGSFALQTFKNSSGQIYITDPNKAVFGVFGFNKSSGELITDATMIGADRQLAYVQGVQRTRTAQATALSDICNSAQAKLAAGYYDRPGQPANYRVIEPEPAHLAALPTYQPINLLDAFAQSKKNQWLIGQNDNGLCTFNMFSTVHAAILGSSNSGKTSSTGLLLATNARKSGMNVIALDAANGIDWMPYSNVFETYETDYRVIGDQLSQIIKMHEQRKKACVLAGVKTIYELDYTIPPVLIVLEEFGRLMQSFKNTDPNGYENIVVALTVLMSDSRKSGINFLFIDQGMQVWDKRFKTNIRDYIAYKMNAKQGSAFDAYDLHLLKPQGQFWNNGAIYNAWHTAAEFKLLEPILQPQRVRLLTDSTIAQGGVSTANIHPPTIDSTINSAAKFTPVSDSTINSAPLTTKPLSRREVELVKNTYALSNNSRKKTVEILYGSWTPSRDKWVKEIVSGEVLQ